MAVSVARAGELTGQAERLRNSNQQSEISLPLRCFRAESMAMAKILPQRTAGGRTTRLVSRQLPAALDRHLAAEPAMSLIPYRSIETRSHPRLLAAARRGFTFYVADPISSIRARLRPVKKLRRGR